MQISLVAVLLASCVNADDHWKDWDGGGRDFVGGINDTIPGLISLQVLPQSTTITHKLNETAKATFKVIGKFVSGDKDLTSMAFFFANDADLGYFTGSTFSTIIDQGGKTSVVAQVGSLRASADLTVKVTGSMVVGSAPKDAADKFGSPCSGPGSIQIANPEAGVMVPPNLADFSVMWTDATSDLWEVSLHSPFSQLKVYTTQKKHKLATSNWKMLALSNLSGSVKVSIRGVKQASLSTCAESTELEVLVGPSDIKGGVYYWTTVPKSAIIRYDFDKPEVKPETYVSAKTAGYCVGCHAISPDGTRLAFTDNWDNPAIMNVKTRTVLSDKRITKASYQTVSPDNRYVVASRLGKMVIRDGDKGTQVFPLNLNGNASQPELSAAGDKLVFVRPVIDPEGVAIFLGGIIIAPFKGSSVGTPTTLVQQTGSLNNYYPSFSPDGKWVIFNRALGTSYSNDKAELWVVAASGGTPIQLTRANKGKNLRNSWPRWSPFVHMYKGRKLFYFSFSSIRDYGTALINSVEISENAVPQIWMTAFDPGLAEAGKDPSYPAFWLPFQELTSRNHLAQWTKKVPQVQ